MCEPIDTTDPFVANILQLKDEAAANNLPETFTALDTAAKVAAYELLVNQTEPETEKGLDNTEPA